MSLLQATNIEPSVSGAGDRGSAVVDLTEGLTISWQVNGSSPMTAYEVQIYENDAESTQKYTTEKVTLASPFYGRNELGEPQFFSFTIPASSLSSAGISNGNEYKYVITQWWGDTDAESITQSSADVFIARSKPVLTIDPIGTNNTVTSNSYTFTASYTQAQGDGIESVRWDLLDGPSQPARATSGTVYTSVLSWTYNGFTPAPAVGLTDFRWLRCTVITTQGVEVTAAQEFQVVYDAEAAQGVVRACCVPGYSGAVRVSWPILETMNGVATGTDYEITNGQLVINKAGTSIAWNFGNVIGNWTVFWAGPVPDITVNRKVVNIGTSFRIEFNVGLGLMMVDGNAGQGYKFPKSKKNTIPFLALAITPTQVTWYYEYVPSLSETTYFVTETGTFPLTISPPTSFATVTLAGIQQCEFLYVKKVTLTPEEITDLFDGWFGLNLWPSWPVFDSQTVMLADFKDGLQAGPIHKDLGPIQEYTVYRTTGIGADLIYTANLKNSSNSFYDYSLPQGLNSIWYVFAKGSNGETAGPMTSQAFAPFFWDWIVIRAAQQPDGTYLAKQVFRFGKNLSSGQIGNNNSPEVLQNFTPYPTILPAPQNYQSGTLSSLIGVIDENGAYSDTIALRDAIYDLSVTTDTLFLKNRKGDLLQIAVSGPITMETNDASASQAQKVGLPWAEVADAGDVSIISLNSRPL